MRSGGKPRRASVLLAADQGQPSRPLVGTRPLYSYWAILAPHFRGVLLPPHNMPDESVQWAWTEPGSTAATSAAELATLRQRLTLAQESLADACDEASETSTKMEMIQATKNRMEKVVAGLVAYPDSTLAGFVARTDRGLYLHSWGLGAPLPIHFPDADLEIAGHVFIDGAPAPDQTVLLDTATDRGIAKTFTDGDGHFSFPRIPVGTYRVRALSRPPDASFPDAGEAVDVQTASVTTVEIHSEQSIRKPPAPLRPKSNARSRRVLSSIVAALLVVAAFFVWRNRVAIVEATSESERQTWEANLAPQAVAPLKPESTEEEEPIGTRAATASTIIGTAATNAPRLAPPSSDQNAGTRPPPGSQSADETSQVPDRQVQIHPAHISGDKTAEAVERVAAPSERADLPSRDPISANRTKDESTPNDGRAARPPASETGEANSDAGEVSVSDTASRTPPQPTEGSESSNTQRPPGGAAGLEARAPAAGASSSPGETSNSQAKGAEVADNATHSGESKESSDPDKDAGEEVITPSPVVRPHPAFPEPDRPFVLRTVFHLSPWQTVLVRDAIVPTVPTRVGQDDGVLDLRARVLTEKQRAMPRTLQDERMIVGLRIEFAARPEESAPHWNLTRGDSPVIATISKNAAEIAWRTHLPTGQFELTGADGHIIARISADARQVIRISSKEPISCWPWLSAEYAAGEEGGFRWQGIGTASLPPSWTTQEQRMNAPGRRLDLRLPAEREETAVITVALVNDSTGWAFTSTIEHQQKSHR